MPVQKYTVRELVRKNTQKKATGLTRDQVGEETETARSMERQKGRALDEPGRLDSLRLAEWAHTEWRRIGYVMTEGAMDVYTPEKDPKAVQWERQRLERVAAESAAAGLDAQGPAAVEHLRSYRVVARRLDNDHPGAAQLTSYTEATSVEEAARKARAVHEREGGVYGVGLYRIVRVEEEQQNTDDKLARLETFVRKAILPRTDPHTTARRRALEALGEDGILCTARTRNADGDVIVCTLDAGHYDPDDKPPFRDGKPGGWHKADASIWNDLGAACIPHAAL
ncbi:hypothetical protein ACF1FX_33550 [Streptomyces sp. NPDC014646]|uniref:hypothetical protein n=1 Tax=Streptomyces sp. NPDC014646 TaxID=3364877 RepID=UPI0036FFA459